MDMDKMVTLLTQLKTTVGLSDEQATQVTACLKSYLKDKMPAFLASSIDDVIEGKKVDFSDILKDGASAAFGQFGDKTEKMGDKAEDALEDVMSKVTGFFDKK